MAGHESKTLGSDKPASSHFDTEACILAGIMFENKGCAKGGRQWRLNA